MWEEKYAANQFEAIMPLSADTALGLVTSLAQTQQIAAIEADADVQHIVRIECQTQSDSVAVCDCILADKYSQTRSHHQLVRVSGQWLTRQNTITPYKESKEEKTAAKSKKEDKSTKDKTAKPVVK